MARFLILFLPWRSGRACGCEATGPFSQARFFQRPAAHDQFGLGRGGFAGCPDAGLLAGLACMLALLASSLRCLHPPFVCLCLVPHFVCGLCLCLYALLPLHCQPASQHHACNHSPLNIATVYLHTVAQALHHKRVSVYFWKYARGWSATTILAWRPCSTTSPTPTLAGCDDSFVCNLFAAVAV